MCYEKLKWVNIHDLEKYNFHVLDGQTLQKIEECSYCLTLKDRKKELGEFFHNYFDKSSKEINILETFNEETNSSLEEILIEKELVHLRAVLFEKTDNKKILQYKTIF